MIVSSYRVQDERACKTCIQMEQMGPFYFSKERYDEYLEKEFMERTELWHENCRCRLIVINSEQEGEDFLPITGIPNEITDEDRIFGVAGYLKNLESKQTDDERMSLKRGFIQNSLNTVKYTLENIQKGFSRIVEFFRRIR